MEPENSIYHLCSESLIAENTAMIDSRIVASAILLLYSTSSLCTIPLHQTYSVYKIYSRRKKNEHT